MAVAALANSLQEIAVDLTTNIVIDDVPHVYLVKRLPVATPFMPPESVPKVTREFRTVDLKEVTGFTGNQYY